MWLSICDIVCVNFWPLTIESAMQPNQYSQHSCANMQFLYLWRTSLKGKNRILVLDVHLTLINLFLLAITVMCSPCYSCCTPCCSPCCSPCSSACSSPCCIPCCSPCCSTCCSPCCTLCCYISCDCTCCSTCCSPCMYPYDCNVCCIDNGCCC